MKRCCITGCNRRHRGRGYCAPHYLRWYRYSDPFKGPPIRTHSDAELYRYRAKRMPFNRKLWDAWQREVFEPNPNREHLRRGIQEMRVALEKQRALCWI